MKMSSLEKILLEHKDQVFSHAFYVLGNREDAEDVTQEVLVKLWENLDGIDKSRCRAWVMRVTHNLCIDRTRERKKSIFRIEDLERVTAKDIMKKRGPQTDPESSLESKEAQRALLRALKNLPAKTRSMLVLHYYHGMKYRTIGEMFRKKVNTIKVEVHRGRKKLKEILADESPEKTGKV